MRVYENKLYQEDVSYAAKLNLPWERLQNSTIILSGATGLIGSFFVDVIMFRNETYHMACQVYALARDEKKARERFLYCWKNSWFHFVKCDINEPIVIDNIKEGSYILHMASHTHPVAYATDPIGTITTNIIGLKNMLDFSLRHKAERMVFLSSNEIYGENNGDTEKFNEKYCGYIDCNTMRAGYPESKRCGEALCQAYITQKGLDIVIPRLTRSYGPTMQITDTKAISQFIKRAVLNQDIILKSSGTQYYSYIDVVDAVTGIFTILFYGECGEAYNIADNNSDITLKELAEIIASYSGRKVIYEVPDKTESDGYSRATKARLDSSKLEQIGWKAKYDIKTGLQRTLRILAQTQIE